MAEEQPMLPLDERFRQAQQFELELPKPERAEQKPADYVCIGNCKIRRRCDGE